MPLLRMAHVREGHPALLRADRRRARHVVADDAPHRAARDAASCCRPTSSPAAATTPPTTRSTSATTPTTVALARRLGASSSPLGEVLAGPGARRRGDPARRPRPRPRSPRASTTSTSSATTRGPTCSGSWSARSPRPPVALLPDVPRTLPRSADPAGGLLDRDASPSTRGPGDDDRVGAPRLGLVDASTRGVRDLVELAAVVAADRARRHAQLAARPSGGRRRSLAPSLRSRSTAPGRGGPQARAQSPSRRAAGVVGERPRALALDGGADAHGRRAPSSPPPQPRQRRRRARPP